MILRVLSKQNLFDRILLTKNDEAKLFQKLMVNSYMQEIKSYYALDVLASL